MAMKAYLAITGTLYALLAVLHFWRAIADWSRISTDPWFVLGVGAIGILAALLSLWAWKLLPNAARRG